MQEARKSFEDALAELEAIVGRLEKGDMTLDESINNFQKGIELSRYCSRKLDEAEKKITILLEKANGEIVEEPMPGV